MWKKKGSIFRKFWALKMPKILKKIINAPLKKLGKPFKALIEAAIIFFIFQYINVAIKKLFQLWGSKFETVGVFLTSNVFFSEFI